MRFVRRLVLCAAVVTVPLLAAAPSFAAEPEPSFDPNTPFVICKDQPYALCAAAACFVYDGVAYCKCDLEKGNSVSLQLPFTNQAGKTRNVCDVIREGRTNGYKVSTFSLPKDAESGGSGAVYTCPGTNNARGGVAAPVANGQCDGGICFNSSIGQRFPGFPRQLKKDEIVCSCPITTAATKGAENPLGYQIFGPYHPKAAKGSRCDPQGCAPCSVAQPAANGAMIQVGAPTGAAHFLALRLNGPPVPKVNECLCTCTAGADGAVTCTTAGEAAE